MNPYIKSLGFTDIMSDSEEKTPTVSPDQGATGETTTSSGNKEARTQTGLSEEEEEACYKEEYNNDVIKLWKNIGMQNPELGRDILMEALLKHFAAENRATRSKEAIFLEHDNLEALSSKHSETAGCVPDWLKADMKYAWDREEFETYLTLLKEVRAYGGHKMELLAVQYILEHKGEAYYRNLCISRSHQEK